MTALDVVLMALTVVLIGLACIIMLWCIADKLGFVEEFGEADDDA